MPTVPYSKDETVDEKRETTRELTVVTIEALPKPATKPEAIVRPLRRKDPSDNDNRPSDLQNLEAQIINRLTKPQPQKAQKESIRDIEKKSNFHWNHSRESKRSSRDVSDLVGKFMSVCVVSCRSRWI